VKSVKMICRERGDFHTTVIIRLYSSPIEQQIFHWYFPRLVHVSRYHMEHYVVVNYSAAKGVLNIFTMYMTNCTITGYWVKCNRMKETTSSKTDSALKTQYLTQWKDASNSGFGAWMGLKTSSLSFIVLLQKCHWIASLFRLQCPDCQNFW
jgi:hypothetical protein